MIFQKDYKILKYVGAVSIFVKFYVLQVQKCQRMINVKNF